MREFKQSKKKSFWGQMISALRSFLAISEQSNFGEHEERMNRRRRKTKFHK